MGHNEIMKKSLFIITIIAIVLIAIIMYIQLLPKIKVPFEKVSLINFLKIKESVIRDLTKFYSNASQKWGIARIVIPFKEEIPFKVNDKYLVLENLRIKVTHESLVKKRRYLFAIGFCSSREFRQATGGITLSYDVAYMWVGFSSASEVIPRSSLLTLYLNASELRTVPGQRGAYEWYHKATGICILVPFTKGPLDISKVIEYIDFSNTIIAYKKCLKLPIKILKFLMFSSEGCPYCSMLKSYLKEYYGSQAIQIKDVSEEGVKNALKLILRLVFNESKLTAVVFKGNDIKAIIHGLHSDSDITIILILRFSIQS